MFENFGVCHQSIGVGNKVRKRAGIERELASRVDQSIEMVWTRGKYE